ncbi:DUF247 domain protein [Zea mays]|uniref:DUF247 domain protein n=1 Tax=Zea mays TaxID=4577 RepID=A0A1D6L4W3_MAIZE|nr:DUF247 domain protein [Zea mays]
MYRLQRSIRSIFYSRSQVF